jgi:hypothetical protein
LNYACTAVSPYHIIQNACLKNLFLLNNLLLTNHPASL